MSSNEAEIETDDELANSVATFDTELNGLLTEYNNVLAQAQSLIDSFNGRTVTGPHQPTRSNEIVINQEEISEAPNTSSCSENSRQEVVEPVILNQDQSRIENRNDIIVLDDTVAQNDDIIFVAQTNNANPVLIDLCSDDPVHSAARGTRRRRRQIHTESRHRSRSPIGVVILDSTEPASRAVENPNILEQSSQNDSQTTPSGILKCAICFDSCIRREPVATVCGHVYCKKCIEQCIRLTHACPLCKRKLRPKQLTRIYL